MAIGIRKEVGNNLETLNKPLLIPFGGLGIVSPIGFLSYSIRTPEECANCACWYRSGLTSVKLFISFSFSCYYDYYFFCNARA